MLVIRAAQMSVLADDVAARFDRSLAGHFRHFAPQEAQKLGGDGLEAIVRLGRQRAAQFEFTNRESIRMYVELMFLLGSGFATDPQYSWAAAALVPGGTPQDESHRASALHAAAIEYIHGVLGANREFVRAARKRLLEYRLQNLDEEPFPESVIEKLHQIFPRKCAYLGIDRMQALAWQAKLGAGRHCLPGTAAAALFAVLMFMLGHEADRDPTIPWVEATLRENAGMKPAVRVEAVANRLREAILL